MRVRFPLGRHPIAMHSATPKRSAGSLRAAYGAALPFQPFTCRISRQTRARRSRTHRIQASATRADYGTEYNQPIVTPHLWSTNPSDRFVASCKGGIPTSLGSGSSLRYQAQLLSVPDPVSPASANQYRHHCLYRGATSTAKPQPRCSVEHLDKSSPTERHCSTSTLPRLAASKLSTPLATCHRSRRGPSSLVEPRLQQTL